MKIDLNTINRESFYVNEHIWNGETLYLVTPKELGCEWNQNNKIFRSSVWNSDGELISASFPKFVNWSEKPEIFPVPTSLNSATVVEKLDGSTLIVSKYKGNIMIRTRGTIDASKLEKNGDEIELFKISVLPEILKAKDTNQDTWSWSYIFEWTSPRNKIVLDYGNKPEFLLIGLVYHSEYILMVQDGLDSLARFLNVTRPKTYTFNDINELISNVQSWEGKEGVCVYSNGGQTIHKVKAFQYLKLHAFKSSATLNNTIELYFELGKPDYTEFVDKITEKFDYECCQLILPFIRTILTAHRHIRDIIANLNTFVEPLKNLPRKDAAAIIIEKQPEYKSYCFTILSGKLLDDNELKKLIYSVLDKS